MRAFTCQVVRGARPLRLARAQGNGRAEDLCAIAFEPAASAVINPDVPDDWIVNMGSFTIIGTASLSATGTGHERSSSGQKCVNDLRVVAGAVTSRDVAAPCQLDGEFAVMVVNSTSGECWLARDALGQQPLYYALYGDLIKVSSRPELLTRDGNYDLGYIAEFLAAGVVRSARTPFADVRAVPPGATLYLNGQACQTRLWWRSEDFLQNPLDSADAPIEECRSLIMSAVSDALNGAALPWMSYSGGVDSSSVVAVAEHLRAKGAVRTGLAGTITVIDSLGSGDERRYTAPLLRQTKLRNEILADFRMWQSDGEPAPYTREPNLSYPFYARDRMLARTVRSLGGDVLLTGDGPDHFFSCKATFLADWVRAGRLLAAVTTALNYAIGRRQSFWQFCMISVLQPLLPQSVQRTRERLRLRSPRWLSRAFAREWGVLAHRMASRAWVNDSRSHFVAERQQRMGGLASSLVSSVAGHYITIRRPLLSRPLVELALRLRPEWLLRPQMKKWLFREAMSGLLPEEVRLRTGKGTIGARVRESIQVESSYLQAMLQQGVLADLGCIEPRAIVEAIERNRAFPRVSGMLTCALALETWLSHRERRPVALTHAAIPYHTELVAATTTRDTVAASLTANAVGR